MDFGEFCSSLGKLDGLENVDKALAILWWHARENRDFEISAGSLTRELQKYGLGNPNSTQLGKNLARTRCVLKGTGGFRLKADAKSAVYKRIEEIFEDELPEVNQKNGFLPEDIWNNTRGYIEKVCIQMNGSFQFGFYDCTAVMARRLVETLIIESYEHLKREQEIKNGDGDYFMLSKLIDQAQGLSISRDTKRELKRIKSLGDTSAHNRRVNAVKADLEKIQNGLRLIVDELVNLASLKRAK